MSLETKPSGTAKNLRLEIRPLIAFRDYHCTTHENGGMNPAVESAGVGEPLRRTRDARLFLAHNAVESQKTSDWYRNFEYDVERERGLDFHGRPFQSLHFAL